MNRDRDAFWRGYREGTDIVLRIVGFLAIAALTAWCFLKATEAKAHDWFTSKRDPVTGASCCYSKATVFVKKPDCVPISDDRVTERQNGYDVRLEDGRTDFVAHERVMPAIDDVEGAFRFFVCTRPPGAAGTPVRCFFAPPRGF